jgi:stage II sporulation protein D
MGIELEFWVRVLLLDDVRQCTVYTSSGFEVVDAESQTRQVQFDPQDWPVKVEIASGKITIAGRPLQSDRVVILPDAPHIFGLNGEEYRGKLEIIANPVGASFDAVNLVPLEPYLAGVVGAEMPNYWEPEALKAQAIAARTYCLYTKRRFGPRRHWDVVKTQANQIYLGIRAESAQIWDAINGTYGQVLVCTHPFDRLRAGSDGTTDIFPTYYSSVCGGHTESSKDVFGDPFEPLIGVPCPYCEDVAKPDVFFWPMVQFDQNDVTTRLVQRYPDLKPLGEIADIQPAKQSDYGTFVRLTLVTLVGSTGKSHLLRAEDLRLTLDPTGRRLKSTICRIVKWDSQWAFLAGQGWGHGVGMCQCGAEGMARRGAAASEILQHYYPGSKITKVY